MLWAAISAVRSSSQTTKRVQIPGILDTVCTAVISFFQRTAQKVARKNVFLQQNVFFFFFTLTVLKIQRISKKNWSLQTILTQH